MDKIKLKKLNKKEEEAYTDLMDMTIKNMMISENITVEEAIKRIWLVFDSEEINLGQFVRRRSEEYRKRERLNG